MRDEVLLRGAKVYTIKTNGLLKNEANKFKVLMVKFCCPLNHFVTSLGRLPKALANRILVKPRSIINS